MESPGHHVRAAPAWQVIGGLSAEGRTPSCPQAHEIEIAQMRDLVLHFGHCRGHDDNAARRVENSQPRSKSLWMGKFRLKIKLRQYSIWEMARRLMLKFKIFLAKTIAQAV